MSDTEILSPASENGDTAITKKRMSERDADSSDESSSYDDKVESSQNGMNEKAVHSNGKEVEGESEDEGSHGFRMDGEPDYKPRKHNMATAVDKEAIRQAYDDVRNDNSDIEWAVFKFEGNNLNVAATGKDFQDFKSAFTNDDRGFGYIRIGTGDEMSKRAKFVLCINTLCAKRMATLSQGPLASSIPGSGCSIDLALEEIMAEFSMVFQLEFHR